MADESYSNVANADDTVKDDPGAEAISDPCPPSSSLSGPGLVDITTEGSQPPASQQKKIWSSLVWFGKKALAGMEYVGEAVADVIGLNDSVFQDVIDEMHDEDWKRAVDVHTEREAEEQEEFSSCAIIDPAVPLGESNL